MDCLCITNMLSSLVTKMADLNLIMMFVHWNQVQTKVVWLFCLSENTNRRKRRFHVVNEFQHSGSARIISTLETPSTKLHVSVGIDQCLLIDNTCY